MSQINLLLVDDHSIVREGLKQLLELDDELNVIGEAGNGLECMNQIEKLNPDLVLLDLDMPVMDGIQVLEELRRKNMRQKVLILTIHNDADYLFQAMDAGASGYVLKDSDSYTLKTAINSVYQDSNYIDATMIPFLKERDYAKTIEQEKKEKDTLLSSREIEVLCYLAEGLCNKEIGLKMQISEKTVKNHVSNIFKKIDVSDRTQAAVYAIKHNFVDI